MLPQPTTSRAHWPVVAAGALLVLSVVALVFAAAPRLLNGGRPATATAALQPPPVPATTAAPSAGVTPAAPAPAPAPSAGAGAPAREDAVSRVADLRRFAANDRHHVRSSWVASFYPIYAAAQKAYGVNWLLLASIHKQETAFSTHETTYRGLNFARCCAGPMQFNVTNGPVTTWQRYRDAFRRAGRPSAYGNPTRRHPSVYDDFDAIMASAALLRDSGAGPSLDAASWRAAYDYYGHDLTGVDYANQVLGRAIGWGRGRFCINCELDPSLVGAVDAAWAGPARAELAPPAPKAKTKPKAAKQHRRPPAQAGKPRR